MTEGREFPCPSAPIYFHHTSQMAQWAKNLPAEQETQEMWVQSLGREGPLEEEMATHSGILA